MREREKMVVSVFMIFLSSFYFGHISIFLGIEKKGAKYKSNTREMCETLDSGIVWNTHETRLQNLIHIFNGKSKQLSMFKCKFEVNILSCSCGVAGTIFFFSRKTSDLKKFIYDSL